MKTESAFYTVVALVCLAISLSTLLISGTAKRYSKIKIFRVSMFITVISWLLTIWYDTPHIDYISYTLSGVAMSLYAPCVDLRVGRRPQPIILIDSIFISFVGYSLPYTMNLPQDIKLHTTGVISIIIASYIFIVFLRTKQLKSHAHIVFSAVWIISGIAVTARSVLLFLDASGVEPYMVSLMGLWPAMYFLIGISMVAAFYEDAHTEMTNLARRGGLTRLSNRWYWDIRIDEEFERLKRMSILRATLMMIDFDLFKYPWMISMGMLPETWQSSAWRKSCAQIYGVVDITGRYGGDEFAFLFIDTGEEEAKRIAERIRKTWPLNISRTLSPYQSVLNMLYTPIHLSPRMSGLQLPTQLCIKPRNLEETEWLHKLLMRNLNSSPSNFFLW